MKKKIAVLGTGRSGTNFFAAVLHELGHDVQHEKFGADGIASWCLVADCNDAVYGPGGGAIGFGFYCRAPIAQPLESDRFIDDVQPIELAFYFRKLTCH